MNQAPFTKQYTSKTRCETAVRNYNWLWKKAPELGPPLLLKVSNTSLDFEPLPGRHAHPSDLPQLAALLGGVHGRAWAVELRGARLDQPWRTADSRMPDYLQTRQEALRRRAETGYLPADGSLLRLLRTLEATATGPAAFYKDSNPRNFLLTAAGEVRTVDFDDLTLAPFGYDLAKLLHTLALAHGRLSPARLHAARDSYNAAASLYGPGLTVSEDALVAHLHLHQALTAPYHDRPHYPYAPRPAQPASGSTP
ncbi:phosphotransferase [Streptacidiphilus sp. EB129]|uniref:phosphotransferase n=1 Tax=Streptacidiphilus sp. EB129 TaxID=3156262 RepID=UPI003518C5EC